VLGPILVIFAVAGIGTLVIFVRWFRSDERAVRQQLATAHRTRIGDVTGGVVCVAGRVALARQVLEAPVSRRPCAAFQVTMFVDEGDSSLHGARIAQATAFWVDDGSGRALVDPGAHFVLALKRATASAQPRGAAAVAALWSLLEERGVPRSAGWREWRVRLEERILVAGDEVTVGGHALAELHVEGQSDGPRRPPTCLVLRAGGSREPLLVGHTDEVRADA
jgi:hypothetical protein